MSHISSNGFDIFEVKKTAQGSYWTNTIEHPDYFYSELGEVYSVKSKRLLKGSYSGRGYKTIMLGGKWHYVHRIICGIFQGPPPSDQHVVRHLDGDMMNNTFNNLVWGTPKENSADMVAHGTTLVGERNPMARLTSKGVAEMRRIRSETGDSYYKIAGRFGVSTMTAFRAITGKAWK